MGHDYTFDDPSVSERYSPSFDVHLPAQEAQSWGERQGR